MDISVVLGSYNQVDKLEKVIDGYKNQQATCSYELIVMDSLSTDGSQDMLARVEKEKGAFDFKYVSQRNSGKAEARNRGVDMAQGDIVIITDADMIPAEGFVQAHYSAHKRYGKCCCFEGLAHNLTSYDWPPNLKDATPQVPRKYASGAKLSWYYFLTGNISFPKSIFKLENGFSLDFTNYGWEDLELGYRFYKRRVPFYYLKDAVNYHYHIVDDGDIVERKYHMGQSAQIFLNKHPELKWFLGMNPISVFIRKNLSKKSAIYKFIDRLKTAKNIYVRKFSVWFLSEYNYLSGILNLKK